jgi:hypothetical protein
MGMQPIFFSQPNGEPILLTVAPALSSWDKAGSAGQLRSGEFVEHVLAHLADHLDAVPDPLGVRLDVGLGDGISPYQDRDLDNYLLNPVLRLIQRTGRAVTSAWATKSHAADSFLTIGTVTPVEAPDATYALDVSPVGSYALPTYKESIRDQIASATPLPGEGVSLQLAYVVGPAHRWPNLWKPTIDALGSILGREDGKREWDARDGRITSLGMHCVVDPDAGYNVRIAVRARPDMP